MSKYDVLIFDVYNIFYKADYLGKNELSIVKNGNDSVHTEGIIKFFQLINSYIEKYGTKDSQCIFLMDNAKSSIQKYRKALSEKYKKTRTPMPEYFYNELNFIELIIKYYRNNSTLYRCVGLEADDYVNNVVRNLKDKKILMFSEDMDWCRNISDNIHQYKDKGIYTKEIFLEKYGFEATYSNICFYKTFYGDKSDNILPTIPTLPKVYFLDIISKFTNVSQMILNLSSLDYLDGGWKLKFQKEEDNLRLNWNLVESVDISDNELLQYKYDCEFKPNKLKIIYMMLNIMDKFDNRIKSEVKQKSIFDMLEGEDLERSE